MNNDPNNSGVTWAAMQSGTACAPTCGNVTPTSSASGSPVTYTAPAALPVNPAVSLVATSVTDSTKTVTAAITVSSGTVELVPNSLNLGRVLAGRHSAPQSVTLSNTGTSALTITGMTISGQYSALFSQTNTCNSSVPAGMSCAISVVFTPNTFGTFSATVSIADSSTDSPQQINVAGTGYTQNPRVSPARSLLPSSDAISVPAPTGAYTVGTLVMGLSDSSRPDPYLANGSKREMAVRFWYPASLTQECKPAEYTSPAVWEYFSQLVHVPSFPVNTNSCWNAPVARGPYPVVIFTPGYTATFTDYTFLFEDLASRGFIVASVAHTYESTAVQLSDGQVAKSVLGSHLDNSWHADEETFTFATSVRLQDLEFVLNELVRLNAQPGNPFTAQLDVSHVAIAGHSMGGVTALLASRLDSRFKAVVMLDAAVAPALVSRTNVPVALLAAGRTQWNSGECRLWSSLEGPRLAVNLRGGEHVTFSDWTWLARTGIQTGAMGPEKTMSAVRDYVAAFLDAQLRHGAPSPLLAGPSREYPDATVIVQGQSLCSQP